MCIHYMFVAFQKVIDKWEGLNGCIHSTIIHKIRMETRHKSVL